MGPSSSISSAAFSWAPWSVFWRTGGGADQDRWRVLIGVGMLGGFTTFSAFSLETALMIERRGYGQAASYVGASVLLAVSALFIGMLVSRRLFA